MAHLHNSCIYRYHLGSEDTSEWSVSAIGKPQSLSETPSGKVLVTCHSQDTGKPDKLVELNAVSGQCVREIALQSDIKYPQHSVQLTTGEYVVCHGKLNKHDDLHRVCIVGDDGKVTRSYGGQGGSDDGRLYVPSHLAVDTKSQFIFVCDQENKRVVILSPTLEFVRYIDQAPSTPRQLYFHQATRHLFVVQLGRSTGRWGFSVNVIQL